MKGVEKSRKYGKERLIGTRGFQILHPRRTRVRGHEVRLKCVKKSPTPRRPVGLSPAGRGGHAGLNASGGNEVVWLGRTLERTEKRRSVET
jgi:hypothetical protein